MQTIYNTFWILIFKYSTLYKSCAYAKNQNCYGIYGLGHDLCVWKSKGSGKPSSYNFPRMGSRFIEYPFTGKSTAEFDLKSIEIFKLE